MFGYRTGYGAGRAFGYVGASVLPYAAILSDLAAQGTPADSATLAWLDANYSGQPYAVLKDSTGSAGAKLQGSGTLLAWWGDGTSGSFTLTGSDQDIGKSGVAASARGIILLGNRYRSGGEYRRVRTTPYVR